MSPPVARLKIDEGGNCKQEAERRQASVWSPYSLSGSALSMDAEA